MSIKNQRRNRQFIIFKNGDDIVVLVWDLKKIWRRITGQNNVNNWINYHGPFAIYLLNFKPENGRISIQTMGIECADFSKLLGSVSPEIRKKNFEKQKALRAEHITRITIRLKGIKIFLKDKVDRIEASPP